MPISPNDLPSWSYFWAHGQMCSRKEAIATLEQYCAEHGYTDPQWVDGSFWGFPPGGVMPVRIPDKVIRASIVDLRLRFEGYNRNVES